MSVYGWKITNQQAPHFITFAVVEWVDVFTRGLYRHILLDSIRHCQQHKDLLLHAWCLMSNHIHLVASAKNANLSNILCDFKKYTSKQIITAIENNPDERRKNWMLPIFKNCGTWNARNDGGNQFWQQDNHPMECFSAAFTSQKIDYIHNNPVKAGIVDHPQEYTYSSARDYIYSKKCGLLDIFFL